MTVSPSQRLQTLPPYLFADLRRKLAALREAGRDPITLGIGDPDQPTPDRIVDELVRAVTDAADADRHRYGCDRPYEALIDSFVDFYRRWYGVALAREQVAVTMGSKDAIVKFCLGTLNPGDLAIAHEPGYPTYHIGHVFAGAETHFVPLVEANRYQIDYDAIPAAVAKRAKLLWLSYPHNPTTATVDLPVYEQAVEWCRAHDVLLCSDAAYAVNGYDGYRAPSALQVPGADDGAVEFFSLSKAFWMTGWRIGALVGHAGAVEALRLVKNNVDNGQLRPIQRAGAWALDHAEEVIPRLNEVYRRRRDTMVAALRSLGWELSPPRGTLYLWVPVPDGFGGDSIRFATHLLETAAVMVTPGVGFGPSGEGYFRVSLTYPEAVLEEATARLSAAL